ncbi:MAG TPA: citrate/2-methylcitrate synthase [Gemmatimonadales bacterium]|jgi:citrate synthase|nr:citrate/2-methylcitrate synthase [Gemmatimonadales bacterium]
MAAPSAGAPPNVGHRLDGAIAADSSICLLSADDNRLAYRGYDVADLARRATYEETAFLLLQGGLPDRTALREFTRQLRTAQRLPRDIVTLIRRAGPAADPMTVLRTAVSALGLCPRESSPYADATALVAQLPPLVAAMHRIRSGERPLASKRGLGIAAGFLYLMKGREAEPELVRAFDAALTLRADNELNPSTFAARVAAATKADVHACVTAALAALAGPQHGGHSLGAYRLLQEIRTPDRVQHVIAERLAHGGIPAFGHPIYREDPRTPPMREAAATACEVARCGDWFGLARAVEERVRSVTGNYPNVDFYLAPLYHALGIQPELFTPVFAVARISGWAAHILEQYDQPGLIRPRAAYVGAEREEFQPLARRR